MIVLREEPYLNSEFGLRKVEVLRNESRSLVKGKSEARKWPKKGSSWLPEVLVNNVYFRWKKRAAPEFCQVCEVGIFLQERSQFLPSRLGLDVGKVALGEFSSAHS